MGHQSPGGCQITNQTTSTTHHPFSSCLDIKIKAAMPLVAEEKASGTMKIYILGKMVQVTQKVFSSIGQAESFGSLFTVKSGVKVR
jgi:hypothetical protein